MIITRGDKMASSSKGNSRRWTEAELSIFAEVLADESNQFRTSLEKLALKKAANNELFEHIPPTEHLNHPPSANSNHYKMILSFFFSS